MQLARVMQVSIIIPCFQQGHLLPSAIDSALAQSFPNVQVIVVNDGSEDDTDAVVRRYADRITYLSQRNTGVNSARNAGVRVATGDYALFLDSDDLLNPNAVKWLVDEAVAGKRDVVVMGHAAFSEDPIRDQIYSTQAESADALWSLIHTNFGPPHCFVISIPMLRQLGGFDESLRWCEEWDCWARAALAGANFGFVPHVGAYYRISPGSVSKNSMRMLQGRVHVLLRMHREFLKRPGWRPELRTELAVAAQRVLRRLHAQNCRDHDLIDAMAAALRQLRSLGVRPPSSVWKRSADWLLGSWADWLAVKWFEIGEPEQFAFYRNGYY